MYDLTEKLRVTENSGLKVKLFIYLLNMKSFTSDNENPNSVCNSNSATPILWHLFSKTLIGTIKWKFIKLGCDF